MTETLNQALDNFRQRQAERSPLAELEATITSAIWHAAERECGGPETRRTDMAFQRDLHLAALAFAAKASQDPQPWVTNARAKGVTWQQVADTLGMGSKQAAQQRYGG